jgi:hypothetical protein
MDLFDEDILNLWRSLEKNQVRYIMIGGFATNLHGYTRATKDIDIWIEDTPVNRKKLRQALIDQGSGDFEQIERIDFVPGWTNFQLNMGFILDVMTNVKGLEIPGFEECFNYAVVAEIENIKVRFLHYNHLITSKKATNRLQDQLDIIELEKIHKKEK